MTTEEAIRRVKIFALHHAEGDLPFSARTVEALEMAIKALENCPPENAICYGCAGNSEDCKECSVYEMIPR